MPAAAAQIERNSTDLAIQQGGNLEQIRPGGMYGTGNIISRPGRILRSGIFLLGHGN
jgi:hypothetical protein